MNRTARKLLLDIHSKRAKIAILGLGYVGLPLAVTFVKKGFHLTGIDIDPSRVEQLRKGRSYVEDIPSKEVREAFRKGRLEVSASEDPLSDVDVVIVCVPTPLPKAAWSTTMCVRGFDSLDWVTGVGILR